MKIVEELIRRLLAEASAKDRCSMVIALHCRLNELRGACLSVPQLYLGLNDGEYRKTVDWLMGQSDSIVSELGYSWISNDNRIDFRCLVLWLSTVAIDRLLRGESVFSEPFQFLGGI